MPTYGVVATAYNKDGKILNSNTHTIKAASAADAERIASGRQRVHVDTSRVDTRVLTTRPD